MSFMDFMGDYGGLLIGGAGALGSYLSNRSAANSMDDASQRAMQMAAPRSVNSPNMGSINYSQQGLLGLQPTGDMANFMGRNSVMGQQALNQWQDQTYSGSNPVTTGVLGGYLNQSNSSPAFQNWQSVLPGYGGVNNQNIYANFLSRGNDAMGRVNFQDINSNMANQTLDGNHLAYGSSAINIDPQLEASKYTNLLRAQAMPQEQQAASQMADRLFATGRLGTTGGQALYGELANQQNQADIQRQVMGQQYGLNNALQLGQFNASERNSTYGNLMAGMGFNNQSNLQAGQYNREGDMSLAGLAQNSAGWGAQGLMDLNNMQYQRYSDSDNINYNRTQDRFGRSLATFGAQNQLQQQLLGNGMQFQGMLGTQNEQLMNLARLGQGGGGSGDISGFLQAAQTRNEGNQSAISGLTGLAEQYLQSRGIFNGAGGQAAGGVSGLASSLGGSAEWAGLGSLAGAGLLAAGGQYGGSAVMLGNLATNIGNSAQMAGMASGATNFLGNIGPALGIAGAAYAGVQGIKGLSNAYQEGDVGGGIKSGLAAGATIGSVVPGVGTVIGGAIGGVVGALAGLAGSPTSHSEKTWDGYKKVNGTGAMAQYDDYSASEIFKGAWDTNKSSFKGGTIKDRGAFLDGMAAQLTSALTSGKITRYTDSNTVVSQVINPWMTSYGAKGASWLNPLLADMSTRLMTGQGIGKEVDGKTAKQMVFINPTAFNPTSVVPPIPPAPPPQAPAPAYTPAPAPYVPQPVMAAAPKPVAPVSKQPTPRGGQTLKNLRTR